MSEKNEKIKMFKEEMDKINSDEYYNDWLTQEEEFEKWYNTAIYEAIEEGIQKGKVEGSKEASIEIAKNMLKMNLEIDTISKATGLSIHEVEALK